jgi:large subunit ribosomal protein L30
MVEKKSKAKAGAAVGLISVEQTGSTIRRSSDQQQTLVGLGLGRIGRKANVPNNPAVLGMIAKVKHLIRVNEKA